MSFCTSLRRISTSPWLVSFTLRGEDGALTSARGHARRCTHLSCVSKNSFSSEVHRRMMALHAAAEKRARRLSKLTRRAQRARTGTDGHLHVRRELGLHRSLPAHKLVEFLRHARRAQAPQ